MQTWLKWEYYRKYLLSQSPFWTPHHPHPSKDCIWFALSKRDRIDDEVVDIGCQEREIRANTILCYVRYCRFMHMILWDKQRKNTWTACIFTDDCASRVALHDHSTQSSAPYDTHQDPSNITTRWKNLMIPFHKTFSLSPFLLCQKIWSCNKKI